MKKSAKDVWHEGFTSAEKWQYDCPYRQNSNESYCWHAGFVQGALKQNGCVYRDNPMDFELDPKIGFV